MPLAPQGDRWACGAPEATRTVNPRSPRPSPPSRPRPPHPRPVVGRSIGVACRSSPCSWRPSPARPARGRAPAQAATHYLLMSRAELLARPTSGSAWSAMKSIADGSLGRANLCDIRRGPSPAHPGRGTGLRPDRAASTRPRRRAGSWPPSPPRRWAATTPSWPSAASSAAYVLAADFIDLAGASDTTFRTWLTAIRTKDIGGHRVWDSLTTTQRSSANNWGAHAGASRIAASLYLGDSSDVSQARPHRAGLPRRPDQVRLVHPQAEQHRPLVGVRDGVTPTPRSTPPAPRAASTSTAPS